MRRASMVIALLMSCYGVFGQKTKAINTDGYARVPNSPLHVFKTDSFKYLRYDGFNVVDVRKATAIQLHRIHDRERTVHLQEDRFWGLSVLSDRYPFPRQSLALRFEQNTGAKIYRGLAWKWGTLSKNIILIDGASDVEIIDGLIKPENANDYRYRIIQNDNKELVGWTTPSIFKKTTNDSATYCFIGNIKYQKNQFVFIEIYNIKNYKDRDAIIIDWRVARPLAFWASMDHRKKHFGTSILSTSLGNDRKSSGANFIATDTLNDVKFRLGDSLIRLGFRSHNLPTPYNYRIILKRIIDGKEEIVDLGETNGTYLLYKEYWNRPGKYEIAFTPKMSSVGGNKITFLKEKTVTYKFTVLPELNRKLVFSRKEIGLISVSVLIIVASIIYFIKRKNQKKLALTQQQKEQSKMQLNSIRSQLNPHFMFNALAGIQSLMNEQKTQEANQYLNKFSRLTRNVLDNKELISLAEEKTLLDDYLQMEQLRFGFSYQINMQPDADLNIEIPAMLLQPFVENAVKHGIAEKGRLGEIIISFAKREKDLILNITDNGNGFDTAKTYAGLGLQLSKSRIELLNAMYKETALVLSLQAAETGTTITITLKQWL